MSAFFEAAVFGIMLLATLGANLTYWKQTIGETNVQEAIQGVSLLTFSGISVVIIVAIIGNRITNKKIDKHTKSNNLFSIVDLLKQTFQETSKGLGSLNYLLLNVATAAIEVWLMVFSFSLGFYALGIEIVDVWSTSALILGGSAFAAIALPPSFAAGPAAAAIFVLSFVGVAEEYAIAYSAIWWNIANAYCYVWSN